MSIPTVAGRETTTTASPAAVTSVPGQVVEPTPTEALPPAYLGAPEAPWNASPDYVAIAAAQSRESNAISSVAANLPGANATATAEARPAANDVEAAQEPIDDALTEDDQSDAEQQDEEGGQTETDVEDEAEADSEATDAEQAKGEEGAGGNAAEDEQSAEQGQDQDAEAGQGEPETSVTLGPGGGARGGDEDEDVAVLVAKLPRMSAILPPMVGSPPAQAIQRREEIIKRTSSPPEQHHARVRQVAEQVTQAARDAQRRMIWNIGNIAKDTRISIEDMADEVLKVTAGAVAEINAAINKAMDDISKAATERVQYAESCTLLTNEALDANRDATTRQVAADLSAGSEAIKKLEDKAKTSFDGYLATAKTNINQLPTQGSAQRLPPLEGSEPAKEEPPPTDESKYKLVSETKTELDSFIKKSSDIVGSEGANSKTYYLGRAAPMVDGYTERQGKDVSKQANKAAEELGSETNRAQFLLMLLGLTTPVSEQHKNDETEAQKKEEREKLKQKTDVEAAHYFATKILTQKSNLAREYADQDLRKNLTDNLWKSGRKAAKGLRKQAASSEITLVNSVVPMAEAYRDLVKRLDALLPANQFLDSRQIVPQLLIARDNARRLQFQHEAIAREQASATVEQADQTKKEQIDGLIKAAADSRQSITDVVTQTNFDMEVYIMQITGTSRAGAGACMQAASEYAERTAKNILGSVDAVAGPGMKRINGTAIGFLNGGIRGAEASQYRQLSAFVKSLEKDGGKDGPLTKPMFEAKKDVSDRTIVIDNAMPEPLSGTDVAVGGLAVVACPILAIPAAVSIYEHDPSENKVVGQLSGIMWPGILALEEFFNASHGDLKKRIEDRLDEPAKSDALALFTTNEAGGEKKRADARNRIINDSTGWFDTYNRETREAAAGAMSSEERSQLTPEQIEATTAHIQEGLNTNQSDIVLAYLGGNRERAVAARTREALDEGAKEGRWGWIFSAEEAQRRSDKARVDAIARMDKSLRDELARENSFAAVMTAEELSGSTNKVYREFASLDDPWKRGSDQFTSQQGREALIGYAIQSHRSAVLGLNPLALVGGPLLKVDIENINMSKEAKDYIAAMVNNDGSEAADDRVRAARGIYEVKRAENEGLGGPSETTQGRVSDALENRRLAQLEREVREAKNPQERSRAEHELEKERQKHRQRMMAMAKGLGAPAEVADNPERAEEWMSRRVGDLFARTDTVGYQLGLSDGVSHRRYGEEMIKSGRASLDASVALATEGLGTNEELLTRSYQDRSKAEIQAANERWAKDHPGEDMEQMLGIKHRDLTATDYLMMGASPLGWLAMRGAETSGDLAMDLEVLAQGNPETDADRVKIANLRYNQQRVRGTGFIADVTMQGTDEQRHLDASRVEMARTILAEAVKKNPSLAERYDAKNPLAIFGPEGDLNGDIVAAAFEDGKFTGGDTVLANLTEGINYASDAYKAEIDRQESILTTSITIMALVASIALMVIPGVNIVAAGIATAIIAGAATVIVKAGMRGERYGWEEAAVDVANAAIEAATAGVGGALSGGLGQASRLAKIGASMEKALGSKLAAAVVRESIVQAISSAASTAIQDETWKDGLGNGLEKVANGAIRGSVTAAISAGISQGLTNKLNAKMNLENLDPGKMSQWQKMATRLGPHASEMFREGLTNGLGALASEAVGVGIDYAQGNFHGGFGDALKQIGMATLRETVSGAARGGVMSMNRTHYRQLLEAARSGEQLGPKELRALRLFAISAGALNYDSSFADIRHEVETAKKLLAQIPPGLREHANVLDLNALRGLVGMLTEGSLGELSNPHHRAEYLVGLAGSVPGLNARELMVELESAIAKRVPAKADVGIEPEQQQHLRSQLGANLHDSVKFALDEVRLDGLQHLSEAELSHAAAMIASGEFNSATADHLLRAAKSRNPELDEFAFLSNLHNAVSTTKQVQQTLVHAAIEHRQQVVALVPKEASGVFAQLGDAEVNLAQRLIRSGNPGTPQELDSLFNAARAANPELGRDEFHGFMKDAAAKVREQITNERQASRMAREARMTHVPEELRGTLSALPEAGLLELRLRQMDGGLSPAEKVRLLDMARHETPDVDLHALGQALDQAVRHPAQQLVAEVQAADMRRQMLGAIPPEHQGLIEHTRILVLPAEEFVTLTRSQKGQAVTLIINGDPVIVVREGANPRVLREEGIHALQAKDPRWAEHIGSLDEHSLSRWDSLPLEQQIALYRNKVALELDAQSHLIRVLESDIDHASSLRERRELEQHLAQVKNAFENLSRRSKEVGGFNAFDIANIKAGFSERPQWLEQPARLFNKAEEKPVRAVKSDEELREELNAHVAGAGRVNRKLVEITDQLTVVEFSQFVKHVNNNPDTARALLSRANLSGSGVEFVRQFIHVMNGLSPTQQAAASSAWAGMKTETLKSLLADLHALRGQQSDDNHFQALIHAATTNGRINPDAIHEFLRIGQVLNATENAVPLAQIVKQFPNPEDLYSVMRQLSRADDAATMAGHLVTVLDSLSPKHYATVKTALIKLTPDVFTGVMAGLAQLSRQVPFASSFHALVDVVMDASANKTKLVKNLVEVVSRLDIKGLHAMASLLDQTDVGMRGEFLDSLLIFSNITLHPLEQGLLGHDSGKLLNLLIETAATQRNWIVFMENAGELLMTMHNLPKTDANQGAIAKALSYLFGARGDLTTSRPLFKSDPADPETRFKSIRQNNELLQLAADINAAAKELRNSPDREKSFNDQVKRQTTEGRLAGSDAWQTHLQTEAMHWDAFKNDKATAGFAKLLENATPHWSDGERAAIRHMHVWFEHLAASRGLSADDAVGRAKLMTEIFDRGFDGISTRNLSSEGKKTALARAFREMAVEAHTGISLDPDQPRNPVRMAEALKCLGLTEQQLSLRSDAEILRKHIYDLVSRQVYYEAMQMIGESIGGEIHGIKQNKTEVIGEIALTQHMLVNEPNFRLETPFGKGTGFDQVWARRDTAGHVVEFVVGEAKGPGAELGTPGKGAQMSAKWIFTTIREMIASSDPATKKLGVEMMEAIKESRRHNKPIIRGVVIEAGDPTSSGSHDRSSPTTGKTGYDFAEFDLSLPLSGA